MTKIFFQQDINSFEQWLIAQPYSQIILLADANTNGFCVPILKQQIAIFKSCHLIVIPQGETNKRLEVVELIWERLIAFEANRNSLLVNVGGGVVSDMGGFAASVFKRGIDYINIPTTLLAQVDASLGGKTGIDWHGFKNIIGCFRHPKAIFIQPDFLHTLDNQILRSGIAEMIKHILISSDVAWQEIKKFQAINFFNPNLIEGSLLFKKSIVVKDEMDNGIRQILNFGHSLGHAIESNSLKTDSPLLHGEAIMLGMEIELKLSERIFQLDRQVLIDFMVLRQKLFPNLNFDFSWKNLKQFLQQDKKNTLGFNMSLLSEVGDCRTNVNVAESLLISILNQYET
jgi:3-dehydroquinate synthase